MLDILGGFGSLFSCVVCLREVTQRWCCMNSVSSFILSCYFYGFFERYFGLLSWLGSDNSMRFFFFLSIFCLVSVMFFCASSGSAELGSPYEISRHLVTFLSRLFLLGRLYLISVRDYHGELFAGLYVC